MIAHVDLWNNYFVYSITDVFGSSVLYDTVCGNTNVTSIYGDADEIISKKNKTSKGDTFQLIYLKKHNENDKEINKNIMNLFTNTENVNEIVINDCFSMNVFDVTNPNTTLLEASEVLINLHMPNPKAIVASIDVKDSILTGKGSFWEVSLDAGRVYVNNIFSGYLAKLHRSYQ